MKNLGFSTKLISQCTKQGLHFYQNWQCKEHSAMPYTIVRNNNKIRKKNKSNKRIILFAEAPKKFFSGKKRKLELEIEYEIQTGLCNIGFFSNRKP